MNKFFNHIKKIINFLLIPVIIFLTFFVKRKKNQFCFGDWFGMKNSDSSFYIFKVSQKDSTINSAWITKSKKIFNELKKANHECYMYNSIEGILFQLRSWNFVSTVNSFDFYPTALFGKKNYIQLGHGLPVKKYFKNYLTNFEKFRFYIRSLTIENYSYYAVTSNAFIEIGKEQYNIDESKILEIPPARIDYYKNSLKNESLIKWSLHHNFKYICYLPTHRDEGKSINEIYNNLEILDNILDELDVSNIKILFKPHFYDIEKFSECDLNFKNIIFLPKANADELMNISDLFIGDYSGVIFDYYYLNKFEIGLCTDYQSYIENHRGMYFELEELYINIAKNKEELQNFLHDFSINKLKKFDSSKYIWEKDNPLQSNSDIAWKKIKETV